MVCTHFHSTYICVPSLTSSNVTSLVNVGVVFSIKVMYPWSEHSLEYLDKSSAFSCFGDVLQTIWFCLLSYILNYNMFQTRFVVWYVNSWVAVNHSVMNNCLLQRISLHLLLLRRCNILLSYGDKSFPGIGAIQVLLNSFSWKIHTHPPPRNANNIEPYTFVTLFPGKLYTPTVLLNTSMAP